MAVKPKLSMAEYLVIKRHNDTLIEGAERDIMQIRSVPARIRPEMVKNRLLYWLDVVKALKWSTAIAAQRAGVIIDNGDTV